MERVADYVIRKISESGARHIFLIVGRGILYLTDAVAKNEKVIPISTYHEQGASYAAMAYASATHGISACLVSTGCAATNVITACLCAYQDNLPVVFLSGNNPLAENTRHTGAPIRTYGSQEADIISMVSSCTKYAVMLEDKETVVSEIEKALFLAQDGRRGPVWIDIPLDVQNMRIDEERARHFVPEKQEIDVNNLESSVIDITGALSDAKRPVLMIGGGARDAGDLIADFVERVGLPVAFSPTACDIYGTMHPLSIGAVGSIGGSRAGNFVVQNSDVLLVLGSKLCSQLTGMRHAFARNAKIVVVDIDPYEHQKDGVHIDKLVYADVTKFLTALSCCDIKRVDEAWSNQCKQWKEKFSIKNELFYYELKLKNLLDIYMIADLLTDILPSDATVITDAGFEELIIPSTICFRDGQQCLFPASQGAMGYALPAIIGAHAANRKSIFCIVGDGSFMMNMQELGLIVSMDIPVKIFVLNNDMYAVIRKRQTDLFRNRTIGNDSSDGLPAPNFKKIADSVGIAYCKIDTFSSFESMLQKLYQEKKAMLVEIMCTPNQKYLHESYALNEKRKLVHRPIEDMAPFLDRKFIRDEMIIDMIAE